MPLTGFSNISTASSHPMSSSLHLLSTDVLYALFYEPESNVQPQMLRATLAWWVGCEMFRGGFDIEDSISLQTKSELYGF